MSRVFDADDRVDDSIEGLILLCQDFITPDMEIVEVGCYRGVSTSIFAQYAKTVYAVDPWMDGLATYHELPRDMMESAEPLFDEMIVKFPNIIKRKGFSEEIAREFPERSIDAVYIDGNHSELGFKTDMVAWMPRVKTGGLIMGHDHCMVKRFLPRVAKTYCDQSWVMIK